MTIVMLGSGFDARASVPTGDLQPAVLDVSINGTQAGEGILLRASDGTIFAPAALLEQLRLAVRPSRTVTHEGETYYALSDLEGLSVTLDDATQRLTIMAAPTLMAPSRLALAQALGGPMTPSATGGFLNYDIFGERSGGATSLHGAFDLGLFTSHGAGGTSFIGSLSRDQRRLTRLDSSWTIDDPARMRSLRLGDGISRGGIGGAPVRFGGVQFGRNFAVQPGFVTLPMPSIGGSAALPSTVDVYVNGTLRGRSDVPAGPFRITDVPPLTGAGELRLVVRDALGRETIVTQPTYAATAILRQGLHDYSYEFGLLRENYTLRSHDYGDLFASTTHRYGVTDWLTADLHVEGTRERQQAGLGAALLLSDLGLVNASVAVSRSEFGQGRMASFGFEHMGRAFSLGARAELTSPDYANVGMAPGRRAPARVVHAFAGVPLSFGSLSATYLLRDGRDERDAEMIGASASFRIGDLGTLNLTAQRSMAGKRNTHVGLFFAMPLGRRTSGSLSMQHSNGRLQTTAAIQKNLPVGAGFGYAASVSRGTADRIDGRVAYQSDIGTYQLEVARLNGQTGVRAGMAGGLGLVGDQPIAARKLTQSFATVKVGDVAGVRVYADHQLVGRTNKNGIAVLPRLRPYEPNRISIETADLPMDVELAQAEQNVRPYGRSGVALRFDAVRIRSAMMTIKLPDGSPLPAGAALWVNGGTEPFVSAPGGDVYLSRLGAQNSVRATWGNGKRCTFSFALPANSAPQAELGQIQCKLEQ